MMKLKMFVMLALTGAMITACSQDNYVPYTNAGLAGTQAGMYNNGLYNNGINNPYANTGLNNNYAYNPYLNNNMSMMNAQTQVRAQAMFSLQFRATTPNFYMPTYTNNNCMMRTQVNYTPSNCACVMAPCNCQQVLTQLRQQTRQVEPRPTRTTRSCSTCTTTPTRTTRTSDDSSDDVVTTNTSKMMALSLVNADARALFDRLAKEEETLANKTKVRSGANYKCFLSGKAKKDESYACDFDINLENGTLYQIYPAGKSGQAVQKESYIYTGKNVVIGGPGMAPAEGVVKISGSMAAAIYKRLPGIAVAGAIDAEGKIQGMIKSSKTLKCYETINTSRKTTECSFKINSESGEALDAQLL